MAFNADEYISVIVEQIGENFSSLDDAVKNCPDLKNAIEKYRKLQNKNKDEFFALREANIKVEMYQKNIGDLVCDKYRTVEPLSVGLFGEWDISRKRPAINVNWHDATAYAKWLSKEEKVEYRLPTADEWYLACNVGQKTEWYFGDDENKLIDNAWYKGSSFAKTHPVGEKKPNELGLYDMHGNVWEWWFVEPHCF